MKKLAMCPVIALLFLAGCIYEAPLTEEHSISIDPLALGLWELAPDKGEQQDKDEKLMILKYSDTEYLIHYPVGRDGMYFRAYPIKIGGVSCVQLQLIGTVEGSLDRDDKKLFHVASYQLSAGELTIKTLNTDLVRDDLKESEALKKTFLKHKADKDLFRDPGRFRKIERKS